jgi:lipid-binding SYLF domain-containing protein
MEGGSVGWQIGASETDVILLVMNETGMQRLLQSKFILGASADVAAGPLGRNASAETDAKMTAQILSWSRSRGVFAGVSLNGATLRDDRDENKALYGKRWTNRQIILGKRHAPRIASEFIATLNRYSPMVS